MTATIQPRTTVTTDGWTWDDLCRLHWPKLVGYAAKKGCSDPESVAGETLADAVASVDGFTGDHHDFGKWLYTIAFRRITDVQRRWYRSPEVLTDTPTAGSGPPLDYDTPSDLHDDHETAVSAFAALDVLSERDRQIITARIIDEQSVAEVASTLGLSKSAVRVYQARALNKIRKTLESSSRAYGPFGLLGLRRLLDPIRPRGSTAYDAWLTEARLAAEFASAATGNAAVAGTASGLLAAGGLTAKIAAGTVALATAGAVTFTLSPGPTVQAGGGGGVTLTEPVSPDGDTLPVEAASDPRMPSQSARTEFQAALALAAPIGTTRTAVDLDVMTEVTRNHPVTSVTISPQIDVGDTLIEVADSPTDLSTDAESTVPVDPVDDVTEPAADLAGSAVESAGESVTTNEPVDGIGGITGDTEIEYSGLLDGDELVDDSSMLIR